MGGFFEYFLSLFDFFLVFVGDIVFVIDIFILNFDFVYDLCDVVVDFFLF